MEEIIQRPKDPLGLLRADSSSSARGFFIRTNTSEFHFDEPDASSEDSSDSSRGSGGGILTRRIALAKQILAEATHGYCASGSSPRSLRSLASLKNMNVGSLGPLLGLLHEAGQDIAKVRRCLDTISFLVLDKANRKTAEDLDCIGSILGVLRSFSNLGILASALASLVSMAKHDDLDKALLWQHPDRDALIDLIHSKQPKLLLLELLACVKNTAFFSVGAVPQQKQLLEPRLISAVASLLHPMTDPVLLQKALHFLAMASECTHPSQMASWHAAAFKIVPLLTLASPPSSASTFSANMILSSGGSSSSLQASGSSKLMSDDGDLLDPSWSMADAALQPLLNLSESPAFQNGLFASGCIAPTMALLANSETTHPVRIAAACLLANLADSSLSRQQLSREKSLQLLVKVLQASSCSEVTVGLLYIMGRLAMGAPRVGSVLRQSGAVQLLRDVAVKSAGDEDVTMGVAQLLTLLGGGAGGGLVHATAAAGHPCSDAAASVNQAAPASSRPPSTLQTSRPIGKSGSLSGTNLCIMVDMRA